MVFLKVLLSWLSSWPSWVSSWPSWPSSWPSPSPQSPQLGAKMVGCSRAKTGLLSQKPIKTNGFSRFCYLGHLGSHLGHLGPHLGHLPPLRAPNLEPRWSPDPPTGSQHSPQTPQLGAKMAPKSPNLEPRWSPDLQLGGNLILRVVPRPPPTCSQDTPQT